MEKGILTYETIREIHRKEKNTAKLQELDNKFYSRLAEYLVEKKKSIEKAMSEEFKRRHSQELENARKTISDIIARREEKIAIYALQALKTERIKKFNMTSEEFELFEALIKSFKEFEERVSEKMNKRKEKIKSKYTVVRMLKKVPAFLGEDLKKYGPLNKDDIVTLPPEVAKVLIDQEKAEEVAIE